MDNNIKINVKITLADIKKLTLESIFNKTSLIFLLLILFFPISIFSFILIGTIVSSTKPFDSNFGLLLFFSIIFYLLIISAFMVFITFIKYILRFNRNKRAFTQNKLIQKNVSFAFTNSGFKVFSETTNSNIEWDSIYKIVEKKSFVYLYFSPYKVDTIPKRCFLNNEKLQNFFDLVENNIDSRKLKIKRYPLKQNFNEENNEEIIENNLEKDPITNDDISNKLFEIEFSHTRNEMLSSTYKMFYSKPVSIIFTTLGLYLIVRSILNLITGSSSISPQYYYLAIFITSFIGFSLSLLLPILLYIRITKNYKNDKLLKNSYTYIFYDDFLLVKASNIENKYKWSELYKIKKGKTNFYFYLNKLYVLIIPKRIFDNKEEELKLLNEKISELNKTR